MNITNEASLLYPQVIDYNLKMRELLGVSTPRPNYDLSCTLDYTSELGKKVSRFLAQAAFDFEAHLISELNTNRINGSLLEFGVYKGNRLQRWLELLEKLDYPIRQVFGFDSFEGLPAPTSRDYPGWEEGQFGDASFEIVSSRLQSSERENLHLIKGWLKNTLTDSMKTRVGNVAFAMIDVDLYEPAQEALSFITGLVVDHGIIAFDDWAFSTEKGESAALFEWIEQHSNIRLEFLASFSWRVYFRVHHLPC